MEHAARNNEERRENVDVGIGHSWEGVAWFVGATFSLPDGAPPPILEGLVKEISMNPKNIGQADI